jgi:hypothetical protein
MALGCGKSPEESGSNPLFEIEEIKRMLIAVYSH